MKGSCMRVCLDRWSPLIFLALLAALLMASCSRKKESRPLPVGNLVQTVQVTRRDFQRRLMAYGYIRSLREAGIVTYTPGRITNIWVKNGERVKKGQRLLSLRGYFGVRASEEVGSSHGEGLLAWGKDIIKIAPMSGYVTGLRKGISNPVEKGETLVSIVDLKSLLAEVAVFGAEGDSIKPGQPAIITSGQSRFAGMVSFLDPQVDPQTGGRKVGIRVLPRGGKGILPGDFVRVEIVIEEHPSALAIPEEALVSSRGQEFVIIKAGPTYRKKPIDTGLRYQGWVEVLRGLSGKEQVVTSGAYELFNQELMRKMKVGD